MAKIGTAQIEINPVLNEAALDDLCKKIERRLAEAVHKGMAATPQPYPVPIPYPVPVVNPGPSWQWHRPYTVTTTNTIASVEIPVRIGDAKSTSDLHHEIHITGTVGWDPDKISRQVEKRARDALAAFGLDDEDDDDGLAGVGAR